MGASSAGIVSRGRYSSSFRRPFIGWLAPYAEKLICSERLSGLLEKVASSRELFN
jgi:hypothetical protein